MMNFSINTAKRINKYSSRISRKIRSLKTSISVILVRFIAFFVSLAPLQKRWVTVEKIETKADDCIVVNCMGCVDLRSDTSLFKRDLNNIRLVLAQADISIASSRFSKRNTAEYKMLKKRFAAKNIVDISAFNKNIKSVLYETPAGNFAIVSYMQNYSSARKRHIRIDLAKEYYKLKRMGAGYVFLYIDNRQMQAVSSRNKRLCNLMLRIGYDYIVNVRPKLFHSGITYQQRNGSVSRAVYGIGTLLSNREALPEERAIIRLKLRKVNGKLQAFEESYFPLVYSNASGLKSLTGPSGKFSRAELAAKAVVERGMSRIRSVDRILTVGKALDVIGVDLPDNLAYLEDFSVGKVCSRSFEVSPGDLFFFREIFNDPNDSNPIDEKKHIQLAKTASKNGAVLLVSFKELPFKANCVICENVMEAHIALCAHLRKQFRVKTIGVTGSIGKTSTKDMVAEVIRMRYNTQKSENNTNVQVKIGMNIQKLTSDCGVYIQEIGGGRPGGASRHSRMVCPAITIVTNIGDAHIGNFYGDKKALMENKLGIVDGMPEDGVVYLNADDPLLVEAAPDCKKVLFAVNNKNADFYADNIVAENDRTCFDIVYDDQRVAACVNVPGEHNVLNAVCAFAIGKQLNISEEAIVNGIANFKTQGIRQNIVSACGVKMFLDCFNASSASIESSIKTLKQIEIPEHGKCVALIGDITGLGDMAENAHKEIAVPLIENPADVFVFYGNDIRHTYEIVKEYGLKCYYVSQKDSLYKLLREVVKPGDVIMAKGSSKMQLEYAFDCVFGTRFLDSVLIEESEYFRMAADNVEYNLFNTHATAVRTNSGATNVKVRSKIGAVTVNNIGTTFHSPALRHVTLPDTIYHIGVGSFRGCKKLKNVEGAKKLKYIGVDAFRNCVSLEVFEFPDTLLHIDDEAFRGCTSLKELHIPESVVQIGVDAFADCPNLKITCKAGSYAESYLAGEGIEYTCV